MAKKPTKKSQKSKPNAFLKFSGMAFQMAVPILLGVWGGIKLDAKTTMKFPMWTILLSLGGVAVSLYVVIKESSKS